MKRHHSRPSLYLESGITLLSSLRRPSTSSIPSLPPSPDPSATFGSPHSGRSPKLSAGFLSPKTPLLPGPGWSRGASGGRRRQRRKWVLAGVVLLLLALICWVYYPFLSSLRSFASTFLRPPSTPPSPLMTVSTPFGPPQPETHYLTYTPHSGLHNQLIALQNALVISAILNRTLLVPALRLGQAVRFVGDGKLEGVLRREGREGLGHCTRFVDADESEVPEECRTYFLHSDLPASSLISLPSLRTPLPSPDQLPLPPYILLPSSAPASSLLSHLNITPSNTYALPSTHVYQHRFYDSRLSTRPLGRRYDTRTDLDDLRASTAAYKLLALGSLFGTSRVKLHLPASKALRARVKRETAFRHPAALAVARDVVRAMGGQDAYYAAHVRLGDGWFERAGEEVVRGVWWRLVREVGVGEDEARVLEAWAFNRSMMVEEPPPPPGVQGEDKAALRSPHPPQPPFPHPPPSPPAPLVCPSPLHTQPSLTPLNAPFFLATPSPSHPLLQPLLRTFPCAFTLSSFPLLAVPLSSPDLKGPDGVPLGKWLMGIVEALVAADAYAVVGTRGSTMSAWVEDVGWRMAHGWEIVDRG